MCRRTHNTHNSISTSPLSTFNGYTRTLAAGLCEASPVSGSHIQPCHGHTTFPPSIIPCPSGPPRCRHTLSIALMVPFTLATQTTLSPTVNSLASFSAGSSDWAASLRNSGMGSLLLNKNTRGNSALARPGRGRARLSFFRRLQCLRDHDLALEILDHAFVEANFGGLFGQGHLINLVLQLEQRVEEVLRSRRTANHIDIRGHDLIHALQHGVGVERAAYRRARAHGDHPLGVGHLVIDALDDRRHLQRDRAGHNHQVTLPRAGTEDFRAEARNIKTRGRGGDHLDGTAGQAEGHGPDRRLAGPVEDVVHRGDQEILLKFVLQPAHVSSAPPVAAFQNTLPWPLAR